MEVTDTVGAGDSFTGAFCAAILKGLPVTEAHKLATEVSAYVYTQSEAMPTQPKEIIGKANRWKAKRQPLQAQVRRKISGK